MNRRAAGIVLLVLSALLLITQYLCAAILLTGASLSGPAFTFMLEYIGPVLPTASAVCLAVGIFYLVAAEIMDIRHKKS